MERGDLDWVRKERNRPECRDWFRQDHPITVEEQQKWFDTTDMKSFVISENCSLVGVVSLSHLDFSARKCEFSIMVVPEHRGKGYGRKALKDLLNHAFNDLNMRQVYSDVFDYNPALPLYDAIGFKRYGTLPNWYYKNGKYINSVIISISKDDYLNSMSVNRDSCLYNEGKEN